MSKYSPSQHTVGNVVAFHYAVDRIALAETGVLHGWAFSRGGEVTARLMLDGEVLAEQICRIPRHDVHRNFPGNPESLLSGFEWHLPLHLLEQLSGKRLELYLCTAESSGSVWTWEGGASPTDQIHIEDELRKIFGARSRVVETATACGRRVDSDPAQFSIHVVLRCSGKSAAALEALSRLQTLTTSSVRLGGLSVICEGEQNSAVTEAVLNRAASWCRAPISVLRPHEFTSWKERYGEEPLSRTLILFIEEDAELQYLDLGTLIQDFLEISEVNLLAPACFGPHELAPPTGVHLGDFRRLTEIHGASMPALFAARSLPPLWLTTAAFLSAVEQGGLAEPGAIALPPSGSDLNYYTDLRQPLAVSAGRYRIYTESERVQMQHLVDTFLHVRRQETPSEPILLIVDSSENYLTLRPQLALAKRLQKEGQQVYLVEDNEEAKTSSLSGFSLIPLSELLKNREAYSGALIIAGSWRTVRSAAALHYILGGSVAWLADEVSYAAFEEQSREHYQAATWAARSELLPLIPDESLQRLLQEENSTFNHAVFFRPSGEVFQPLPQAQQPQSLLFVSNHAFYGKERPLGRVLELLKAAVPDINIGLCLSGKKSLTDETLKRSADRIYHVEAEAEAASLFQQYQTVVICSALGERSTVYLDAAACGAKVVSCAMLDRPGEGELTLSETNRTVEQLLTLIKEPAAVNGSDVRQAEEVPLVQRIREAEQKLREAQAKSRAERRSVSIIIPVYCALDATVQCIRSVLQYAPEEYEIIVVNDVSDLGTSEALRQMAASAPRLTLVNKTKNGGFVQACLSGLKAARPENDIVLLNSDVVLTRRTLEALQNAAYARAEVGLASSLSTNSPFLQLQLNGGDSLESAAEKIAAFGAPRNPTVITPEGQLLYIRRWALEKFGFLDPVYNRGFCEESDMCMRMFLHGVDMVVADDALISHRKSESFGSETSLAYKHENRPIFDARWGRHYWMVFPEFLKRNPLAEVRSRYRGLAPKIQAPYAPLALTGYPKYAARLLQKRAQVRPAAGVIDDAEVVFIVPSVVLGGGTLSVLQHANEMLMRGIQARVLSLTVPEPTAYPYLAPPIAVSPEQLMELQWSKQKVVATLWLTAYFVKALIERYPQLDGYYYIQDYEPWFYSRPDHLPTVLEAEETYRLGLKGVVKTQYLRDLVKQEHNVDSALITPGLSRTVFYPGEQDQSFGRPSLTAYYRPRTPRRGGKECLEVLKRVKARVPEARLQLFGEDSELPEDMHDVVEMRGRMSQAEVAKMYRSTDIVLDMSYWHGFGRMGIEAMASGAVPVLSDSGGIRRYATNGENSFVVPIGDVDEATECIVRLMKDPELRLSMRVNALETACRFSESMAVDDWLEIMGIEGPFSFEEGVMFPGVAKRRGLRRVANLA